MDSAPVVPADLSSAQRHVLVALKKRGEASADELAEALGITPSGVRQHLAALRAAGLVAARQERGRPGRPADLYHSTDLGETLFARASGDLSVPVTASFPLAEAAAAYERFQEGGKLGKIVLEI